MQKLIHLNYLEYSIWGKLVSSNVSNQILIYRVWLFLIHEASLFFFPFSFLSPSKKITSYIQQFQGNIVAEKLMEKLLRTHSWQTSRCLGNGACPSEQMLLLSDKCASPSAKILRAGPGLGDQLWWSTSGLVLVTLCSTSQQTFWSGGFGQAHFKLSCSFSVCIFIYLLLFF